MSSCASLSGTQPGAADKSTSASTSFSASASHAASHGEHQSRASKKSTGTAKPLKRVLHTPQMVVKVRDCPSSNMPIELCYQCFGDPNAGLPPVLLICGLNMQMYAWDEEFCEALVRAGFYVIRYDNRDMGHSTKIEHRGRVKAPLLLLPGGAATWLGEKLPYSVEDMAADAWALLDALHLPCAHLFGISMGGMIAQTAALLAPERTMSLTSVMSSTNAPDLPQPQLWVKLWMLRKPPKQCTVEELLEFRVNSLRRLLRSALPPDGEYLKKRYLMSLKRSSYSAGLVRQAATIRRAVGRDAALQKLYVPALVVHGAQDVVVPPMHGYRTATMLPYARMLVLKSMGHYFHPAFFSTIIEAFADMAASTDPAKRGLGSRLPSASSMQLLEVAPPASPAPPPPMSTAAASTVQAGGPAGDGNTSAAAAWRRGGGSVSKHSPDRLSATHRKEQASSDASATAAVQVGHVDPNTTTSTAVTDTRKKPQVEEEATGEEAEGQEDGSELSCVDPKTLMMASMGSFIQPVVADASSPIGMAACRSVMVAVPGGNSNPGVPEAVIVENIFLRNPHAVPSVPTANIVKRPVTPTAAAQAPNTKSGASPSASAPSPFPSSSQNDRNDNRAPTSAGLIAAGGSTSTAKTLSSPNSSSGGGIHGAATVGRLSSAKSTTSPTTTTAPGKLYASPLAMGDVKRPLTHSPSATSPSAGKSNTVNTTRAVVDGTTTTTLPKPLPMDGAVPYVPCSPSRWHEVAPFPQRSGPLRPNPNNPNNNDNTANKTNTNACQKEEKYKNSGEKGGVASGAESVAAAGSSLSAPRAFPEFHPLVVGVPVNEYLDAHPMERETSGLVMTGTNVEAAAAAFDLDEDEDNGNDVSMADKRGSHKKHLHCDPTSNATSAQSPLGVASVLHPASAAAATMHSPSRVPRHGSLNEASWTSATALHEATPSQLLKVGTGQQPDGLFSHEGMEERGSGTVTNSSSSNGGAGTRTPASRSSSQERRENESFLQAKAPEEVVEATALPSL